MAIWRMRTACWIRKATNTHSEYLILIDLLRQQRLRERASMLRHTYIACVIQQPLPPTPQCLLTL